MRKIIYASISALALLLTLSCDNSSTTVEEKAPVNVLATLENGREWKSGDEVVINNIKYTVVEGGKSTTTIENVTAADYYYAAYDFGKGNIENTYLNVEVPAIQGPAITMIQPMVASNGTQTLYLRTCSVHCVLQ